MDQNHILARNRRLRRLARRLLRQTIRGGLRGLLLSALLAGGTTHASAPEPSERGVVREAGGAYVPGFEGSGEPVSRAPDPRADSVSATGDGGQQHARWASGRAPNPDLTDNRIWGVDVDAEPLDDELLEGMPAIAIAIASNGYYAYELLAGSLPPDVHALELPHRHEGGARPAQDKIDGGCPSDLDARGGDQERPYPEKAIVSRKR